MASYEPFKYYKTTSVRLNEGIDMLKPARLNEGIDMPKPMQYYGIIDSLKPMQYNERTACESIMAPYETPQKLSLLNPRNFGEFIAGGQDSSNEKLQEALEEQVKLMGEISKLKEQQGAEQKAMKALELTIKEQNNTIASLKRQLDMASTWQADTGPKSPIKTILCLGFAFLLGIAATVAVQQGVF